MALGHEEPRNRHALKGKRLENAIRREMDRRRFASQPDGFFYTQIRGT